MNWEEYKFADIAREIDWQDDPVAGAKKVEQWGNLARQAEVQIKEATNVITKIEQHCEKVATDLHPAETFPADTQVVSTQFWQANYPGLTSLRSHCNDLINSVGNLKSRLQLSVNNAEPMVYGRKLYNHRELDATRLFAALLHVEMKMLEKLGESVRSWSSLPTNSHDEQKSADAAFREIFRVARNTFNTIHTLSNSVSLEMDASSIGRSVSRVNLQEPIFRQMLERAFPPPKQEAEHTQPAFPREEGKPLAVETGMQIVAAVTEDESTAVALEIRGVMKQVSRAWCDLVTSAPVSEEIKAIEEAPVIEASLAQTNDDLVTAATTRNKTFTSAMHRERATKATTGKPHVALDIAAIHEHKETIPDVEKRSETSLDIILSEPRKTLAIRASGIKQPIRPLLEKLKEFHDKHKESSMPLKDVRLDLSNTDLKSADLELLKELPVTFLNVAHNKGLDATAFEHMAKFGHLTTLDASGISLTVETLGITANTPGLFQNFADNAKQLKKICLNYINGGGHHVLCNELLAALATSSKDSLEVLEFRGNGLRPASMRIIQELHNLRRLDVNNNPNLFDYLQYDTSANFGFPVRPERNLAALEGLTHLMVSNTGLNTNQARYLIAETWPLTYSLPRLEHFDASNNNITADIAGDNRFGSRLEHPTLQKLNLRGNRVPRVQDFYEALEDPRPKKPLSEDDLHVIASRLPSLIELDGRKVTDKKLAPDFAVKSQSDQATPAVAPRSPKRGPGL